MIGDLSGKPQNIPKTIVIWAFVCGAAFALSIILRGVDDTIELLPDHSNLISLSFAFAGLAAVTAVVVVWRATRSWPNANRMGFALASFCASFLSFSLVITSAAEVVAGWVYFPPSKIITYKNTLIRISRAYQIRGKNASHHVQTTPLWADIEITPHDYEAMLDHRRPRDYGINPDEISSLGYFCAQVTIQEAGDAIRITHARFGVLPQGSIIVCPSDFDQRPHV